jgi:hypothetical protein
VVEDCECVDQFSTGCTDENLDEVHNNIHKDH